MAGSATSKGHEVVPDEASGWTEMGLFDAIYGLRATRIYQDRPLPGDVLERILRSATMACSSGNTQPWEFVVVADPVKKGLLKQRLAEAFSGIDAQRAQTAEQLRDGAGRPVTGHKAVDNVDRVGAIVMVFWNPDRGVRFQDEYVEEADGSLTGVRPIPGGRGSSLFPACQNMMLAAHALGVSSLFTTFFGLVEDDVKRILNVPKRMFLECAVFLGYGDEDLKRPRRKAVRDVAHLDDWDQPFDVRGPGER